MLWAYALGESFGPVHWACALGNGFERLFWVYLWGVGFKFNVIPAVAAQHCYPARRQANTFNLPRSAEISLWRSLMSTKLHQTFHNAED